MADENIINVQEDEGVAPAGETKAEKFKRLATYRTQKALKALSSLENLSNRASYEYTEEDVEKIFGALTAKIEKTRALFSKTEKKEEDEFKL